MRRILWFRRDLRVQDNPLLAKEGEVLPIFIFDPHLLSHLPKQSPRVDFIFEQVLRLKEALQERGLDLAIFYDNPRHVFERLDALGFDEVCSCEDHDPYVRTLYRDISHILPFHLIQDTYWFRPQEILKKDGSPYLVFTPFYNHAKEVLKQKSFIPFTFANVRLFSFAYDALHVNGHPQKLALPSLGFVPSFIPLSYHPHDLLKRFEDKIDGYEKMRDFPAQEATSYLSAHLHYGTLSLRALWLWLAHQTKLGKHTEPFLRQLLFREFYASLLYHFPYLETKNFKYTITGIYDETKHRRFCEGNTGVPFVDAGIRQLLHTGTMHNRVRMVCASFYTKDLLLPWQNGADFFAQHLIDYDKASNTLSWQWSAGTGVDPQPYFRIFNPYLQSKRFDKEGTYITRYIPQLAALPSTSLHDETFLMQATLQGYPRPMVHHKEAADQALKYYRRA